MSDLDEFEMIPPITTPSIPTTLIESIRILKEDSSEEDKEWELPTPSIPYGWEDTKDWSWR